MPSWFPMMTVLWSLIKQKKLSSLLTCQLHFSSFCLFFFVSCVFNLDKIFLVIIYSSSGARWNCQLLLTSVWTLFFIDVHFKFIRNFILYKPMLDDESFIEYEESALKYKSDVWCILWAGYLHRSSYSTVITFLLNNQNAAGFTDLIIWTFPVNTYSNLSCLSLQILLKVSLGLSP